MSERLRTQFGFGGARRVAAMALVGVSLCLAGLVKTWSIEEFGAAPVLAVCQVMKVTPPGTVPCTAELRILRASRPIGAQATLHCPVSQLSAIGPVLEQGRTYLLPLARSARGWSLIGNEGQGLSIAVTSLVPIAQSPISGRGVVIREIVNTLLRGSYADLFHIGTWLRAQASPELAAELMVHLEEKLKPDSPRWLDLATAMLANHGIPRTSLDELAAGTPGRDPLLLPLTLRKIPAETRKNAIIQNMLRHSDIHEWGTAATLVPEFKDDPLLLDLLPEYLRAGQPGVLMTAWWLVRNQQMRLLAESLEAAVITIGKREASFNEILAAGSLLLLHGSDEQFLALLTAVRTARKEEDSTWYRRLWSVWDTQAGPRVIELIRAVIDDDRVFGSTMRFSDLAGMRLQAVTGQQFGFTVWDQDLASRDGAVGRARAWLAKNPAPQSSPPGSPL